MATDKMKPMPNLVVVIPTLDEEIHIRRAVDSALSLGHVVVVDSGSSDDTRRIGREMGAEVLRHAWEGYAAQKNWALAQVMDKFEWVLFLDADEWISHDLSAEIRVAIESTIDGFHIPRLNVFEGRVLRHAWWYPDYQLRLFRAKKGRFEDRRVHEHVIVDGQAGFLERPLMHENLKGLESFIHRHARYADLEAREILKARWGAVEGNRRARLLGSWPERRRFLKVRVWYRMPFRPAFRFVWMFVVKRGFLDGRQGLIYCQLIAAYEAMIDARLLELERAAMVKDEGAVADAGTSRPAFSCPECRSSLIARADGYECGQCGRSYPIVDGIPVLLLDVAAAEHETSGGHVGQTATDADRAHKGAQSHHFDEEVNEEFEITRPHGAPRIYGFFLAEKFRRATRPIGPHLIGVSALTVCGGSGMDAESLARRGAQVVASDISLNAARRTRERARRYRLDITPIVADIERLPFADGSFDLVLVHDGLHHLAQPEVGLREMARIARRWVSVTEPARALATAIAVRAGIALEQEEAGNRVIRFMPSELATRLQADGFRAMVAERYAMYYPHVPGPISRVASRPGIYPLARAAWRIGNAVFGRVGNKMVVVAERIVPSAGPVDAGGSESSDRGSASKWSQHKGDLV